MEGELGDAVAQFGEVVAEAEASADVSPTAIGLMGQGQALAVLGDVSAARAARRVGKHPILELPTTHSV